MRRRAILESIVDVVLAAWLAAGLGPRWTDAQDATPMTGMTTMPAGAGVKGVVLARIAPPAAPGQELQLFRLELAPGAIIAPHTHPGVIASCVAAGALGFTLLSGTGTVTRAATAATPTAAEPLVPGREVVLAPGDCLTFDATTHAHSGRNAAAGPTVLWEAHLYAAGQPLTTYLGTPAA